MGCSRTLSRGRNGYGKSDAGFKVGILIMRGFQRRQRRSWQGFVAENGNRSTNGQGTGRLRRIMIRNTFIVPLIQIFADDTSRKRALAQASANAYVVFGYEYAWAYASVCMRKNHAYVSAWVNGIVFEFVNLHFYLFRRLTNVLTP